MQSLIVIVGDKIRIALRSIYYGYIKLKLLINTQFTLNYWENSVKVFSNNRKSCIIMVTLSLLILPWLKGGDLT
ncbi:Uncharacterised protein [Mycobacteroides abscessus subsp. abscessus]|nr:Uncharacterised protein [Mycobacteroides abscessus subsp. abscessus]